MKTFLCLLLINLAISTTQANQFPEAKLSFNYEVLDVLKTTTIKPLVEEKLRNLTINDTFSYDKGHINVKVSHIQTSNFTLDWENSHLLFLNRNNKPSVMIKNLSLALTFDADLHLIAVNFTGKDNICTIQGLDVQVDLNFGIFPNKTTYMYIDSANVSLKNLDIHLSDKRIQIMVIIAKLLRVKVEKYVSQAITKAIISQNQTLVETSMQGFSFEIFNEYRMSAKIAELPYTFKESQTIYQTFSLNIETRNIKTNQTAPNTPADPMPDFINNDLPLQLFLSENIVSQAFWAAFQSEKLEFVFSNKNLPPGFPIALNSTDITLLFPNITRDYGANKGLYLKINKGTSTPLAFIRDGRLIVEIGMSIEFWVDTDSSHYPDQGLENCVTCEKAVALDASAFAAVVFYGYNATYIGVKIMGGEIVEIKVLTGDVNGENLAATLNNLLIAILLQTNAKLETGVKNPLIGKFGVDSGLFEIGADYVFVGLSLGSS